MSNPSLIGFLVSSSPFNLDDFACPLTVSLNADYDQVLQKYQSVDELLDDWTKQLQWLLKNDRVFVESIGRGSIEARIQNFPLQIAKEWQSTITSRKSLFLFRLPVEDSTTNCEANDIRLSVKDLRINCKPNDIQLPANTNPWISHVDTSLPPTSLTRSAPSAPSPAAVLESKALVSNINPVRNPHVLYEKLTYAEALSYEFEPEPEPKSESESESETEND